MNDQEKNGKKKKEKRVETDILRITADDYEQSVYDTDQPKVTDA